jgi:hypothetical protein
LASGRFFARAPLCGRDFGEIAMAGGGVLQEKILMKEEEPTPVVPSSPGSYFNKLILLKPEMVMYRSSPISPSHRALFATSVAEQVTVTWTPVEVENEPAAVAAWFVNMVRPEIGAENALALQQIIEAQWEGTFSTFFRNVADYRGNSGETAG